VRSVCGLALVILTSSTLRGQSDTAPRPVADHHVHLQSLAMWRLFNGALPVITPPEEIDRLLRDFERGWRTTDNKVALAEVFTDDGLLQWGDDWARGGAAIRINLLGRAGGLRLRPQAVEAGELLGHVAGMYGYYRDTAWVEQGRYLFSLRRGKGMPWRISAAILHNTTPPVPPTGDPIPADRLIAQLDSVGTRRGVVLSLAYQYGARYRRVEEEQAKVRAENDWVAAQVARYPDRLVGFCSLNPLKEYALAELERCTRLPGIVGLKMHFTTSFVDLRDPRHVERLRAVFRAANARRFPVVVHMRTMDPAYGRRDAEVFLRELLPEAPDIPVQIAHLAGWGEFVDATDQALAVFAEAIAAGDRRTANLLFDLSGVVNVGTYPEATRQLIVRRMRQIGMQRLLFAVDGLVDPRLAWRNLQALPLDASEIRMIAANLAPYLE
jgi:predicted TIM-barrel fold metal-dependent hydrolase